MEWIVGALPLLVVLACPIGMVVLMRMMGMGGSRSKRPSDGTAAPARGDAQRRLALLELRQAALDLEIAAVRRDVERG